MITVTLNSDVLDLLEQLKTVGNNAARRDQICGSIVTLIQVQIRDGGKKPQQGTLPETKPRHGEGVWNQRVSKFPSSCSGCGEFIEAGTKCWLTVGQSPRCNDCGKPTDAVNG